MKSLRIFHSDNGTLVDLSSKLERYQVGEVSFELVSADDYLFIGARLPFNHLYFAFNTLNATTSNPSVDYWDGDEWVAAVEISDETNGMTQNGFVEWVPDEDDSWSMESTSDDGETITGLESVKIYDRYWVRIGFDADIDAGTELKWVGNVFCDDDDIGSEFPDLNRDNVKTAFMAGKTDWQEQCVRASELLVQDLINAGKVIGAGQILNREDYRNACVMKTAEVIYRSMGGDYSDEADKCRAEYKIRMASIRSTVDKNLDAKEQVSERSNMTGFMSR